MEKSFDYSPDMFIRQGPFLKRNNETQAIIIWFYYHYAVINSTKDKRFDNSKTLIP